MTRDEQFNPISKYIFLTQILNSACLLDDKEEKEMPKIDAAIKLFNKLHTKMVLFTQLVKWFDLVKVKLARHRIPVIEYHGSLSAKDKFLRVQQFKDAVVPTIFLCTEAASHGINLQFCHTLVVVDFMWNPVSMLQLFGRINRLEQKNSMSIYYLVAEGTHEERIFKMLHSRQSLIDAVLNSNESACFDLQELFKEMLTGL